MDCRVEPWCENCRGGETKLAKEGDGAAGAVLVYCSGGAGVVLVCTSTALVLVQCWWSRSSAGQAKAEALK